MPGSGQGQRKPSHSPWLIAVSLMLATFMEVMDTSIASVAVPYIAGSVATSNNDAEWVLTVYLIANAVFLPSSTWFSEKFGRKRTLNLLSRRRYLRHHYDSSALFSDSHGL